MESYNKWEWESTAALRDMESRRGMWGSVSYGAGESGGAGGMLAAIS